MSFNLTALTEYVEENRGDLIRKSFLAPRTMDYVTIQAGIKYKETINIIEGDIALQAGHCSFDADGGVIFTQEEIEVSELRVNEEYCIPDLNKFYLQKSVNPGSWNESMGPLEGLFAETKREAITGVIDEALWLGDTTLASGNNSFFDGIIKKIDDSGVAIDGNVDAVTVATGITPANIIDIVDGINQSIHEDELGRQNYIFMSYANYRMYAKALRDANLFHYTGAENQRGSFIQEVPGSDTLVVAMKNVPNDRMFSWNDRENMFVGTDVIGEEDQFDIWYSKDDRVVKFAAMTKLGVGIAFPDRIVEFTLVP